jgi:DNA-directed RNA polymerase specialized sigma24 family protein
VTYPPGVTEESFLAALDHCRALLARDFAFAYYDRDDIAQEMFLMAAEALPRYDTSRPLPNFLHAHLVNRLKNLRRDKFQRADSPCRLCYEGRHREHAGGRQCAPHLAWRKRNSAKANLASPSRLDCARTEHEAALKHAPRAVDEADHAEAAERLNALLPPELRATFLRLKAGQRVGKADRDRVRAALAHLLPAADEGPE